MYSLSARFNQICYFTSFTLFIASVLNQLTSVYFFTGDPQVSFNVVSIDRFYHNTQRHYNGGKSDWEQANLRFDLEIDFEPIFHWNLRQIFLYVNVHFVNQKNNYPSDVVIFDQIIQRPSNPAEWPSASKFKKKAIKSEYPIRDVYKNLRNQNVTFEIWIEVLPQVGIIYTKKLAEYPYIMPSEYK